MGNRGLLHDDAGMIRRDHGVQRWITCLLEFKGRRRQIMRPGHYTELFFLDEATSLAAGHRPCAECRRADYNRFREAWAVGQGLVKPPSAPELDAVLQDERLGADGAKRTYASAAESLPEGTFFDALDSPRGGSPRLIWRGRVWEWSPGGYADAGPVDPDARVAVLTPPSTVAALAAGYVPAVAI